jgi:hypothetical protein
LAGTRVSSDNQQGGRLVPKNSSMHGAKRRIHPP